MPRIVHFDIQANDPNRAAQFYRDVFGWKVEKWKWEGVQKPPMDYWIIETGLDTEPGINGGMSQREGLAVEGNDAFVCTVGVDDVDVYIEKIEAAGGEVTMPKSAIPKVGWFASFKDTEGNKLGLMQSDMQAE